MLSVFIRGNPWRKVLGELAQEPNVSVKEQLYIVDAVLHGGEAVEAHAEGEAAHLLRVVSDVAVERGIDHAGA